MPHASHFGSIFFYSNLTSNFGCRSYEAMLRAKHPGVIHVGIEKILGLVQQQPNNKLLIWNGHVSLTETKKQTLGNTNLRCFS